MAQAGWIYADDNGHKHAIGLYHGDKSGHLVIYINQMVMTIDFSVLESRTYTFFVEDELCEIALEKEKDMFTYSFNINKEADTPRNRARAALDTKYQGYMYLMIMGILVLATVLVYCFRYL